MQHEVPGRWARTLARAVVAPAVLAVLVALVAVGVPPRAHDRVTAGDAEAAGDLDAVASLGSSGAARLQPDAAPTAPAPVQLRAYAALARRWDAAAVREAAPAGSAWRSLDVGGQQRRFLLSLPPGGSGPAPLVVAFHGLAMHAAPFAVHTGLIGATRAAGQVLVVPESDGPAFNDGRLGPTGPDDEAFALEVVDELAGAGLVDRSRVVVTGFSNGAGMAMAFASNHPEATAAVVSIAGSFIRSPTAARPTGPVEAVLLHGTADRVQPWSGRPAGGITRPPYIAVPQTAAAWVSADLAGAPVRTALRVGRAADPVRVTRWTSGPLAGGVTTYTVVGLGHRWPLTTPVRRGWPDVTTASISATDLVVQTAATARTTQLGALYSVRAAATRASAA